MEDLTPFDNFDTFFAWYINVIKSKVDGFNVTMPYQEIHLKMGLLTKEQQKFTEKMIRKIQNLPKNVPIMFTNYNDIGTFASRWNGQEKKAEIVYPSVCYYWLRYPELIRTVIQHELGHIVNRDIFYKSENGEEYQKAHSHCINLSMDCRINQNLDYQNLDYINRCLFSFNNEPFEPTVPETFAVKKCGLPISLKGKLTWTLIHKNYHVQHPEPMENNEQDVDLILGQYVMTLVEKNGVAKGTYGRIIEKYPDYKYQLVKITDEEIKALKDDDYKFFENFNDYISVLGGDFLVVNDKTYVDSNTIIEPYQYILTNKEVKPIPVPKYTQVLPQEGMIALAIKDINNIPEANFALIIKVVDVENKKYELLEFNEEVQRIIGKGDARKYYELFREGGDMFTDNQEVAIYLEDFVLKNLQPPQDNPPTPPPPPPEKEVKKPKIGDVVVLTKEGDRGKYGVIKAISEDGKYTIEEVSEKVAKSMVAKRESRNE